MEAPAADALEHFYRNEYDKKAKLAEDAKAISPTLEAVIPADSFFKALKDIAPKIEIPPADQLKGKTLSFPLQYNQSTLIKATQSSTVMIDKTLISLGPLETITIYFMVCLVTGLVLVSPWVFYQGWAFVAAGLYRHERHYVQKYLPISLGLFLTGVFLCFGFVLPITLGFLLEFNVWLGVAPTLRLSEWMSFATILPLVFGIAFQTPLIMLFLERIGIFTAADFRAKRKIAILIITDRRGGPHARPGPLQHDPPGRADDPALRAGHPPGRSQQEAGSCPVRVVGETEGCLRSNAPGLKLSLGCGTSQQDVSSLLVSHAASNGSGEGHGTRHHWIDRAGHRGNGRRPDLDRACRPHRPPGG